MTQFQVALVGALAILVLLVLDILMFSFLVN